MAEKVELKEDPHPFGTTRCVIAVVLEQSDKDYDGRLVYSYGYGMYANTGKVLMEFYNTFDSAWNLT